MEKGADRKKLVMGMPLYGQAFTLNSPSVSYSLISNYKSTKARAMELTICTHHSVGQ